MRSLTLDEMDHVSAGRSLFYSLLLVGQVTVGSATAYATLSKVKREFLTLSWAPTITSVLTTEISGIPIGAMFTTGIGATLGYYAYSLILAVQPP